MSFGGGLLGVMLLRASPRERKLARLERERPAKIQHADYLVVSFPKSGRTWLRAMLSRLYHLKFGTPADLLISFDNLHRLDARVPKIFFLHHVDPLQAAQSIDTDKAPYDGRNIVFLARHPADAIASLFFQYRYRKAGQREDILRGKDIYRFATEPGHGIHTVIAFMNQWIAYARRNSRVLLVRYEAFHADAVDSLGRVATHFGDSFSDAELADAVAFSRFENLRGLERDAFYTDSALRAGDRDNPDSYKVRCGQVGGYRAHFTPDQVAEIDRIVSVELDSEFGYGESPNRSVLSEQRARLRTAIDRPPEIARIFEPMVLRRMPEDDPAWQTMMAALARKTSRGAARQRWLGWIPGMSRDQVSVRKKYERIWAGLAWPDVGGPSAAAKPSYCSWRGQCFETVSNATKRPYLFALAEAIRTLAPESVLEIGAGNGVNILTLAGMLPEKSFTGVELTEAGVRRATAAQADVLPNELARFAPLPIRDPEAHRRVRFLQADVRALPFPDGAFDLVFTMLALEQMETIRNRAVTAIARVAARYAILIEPFGEWNQEPVRRDYIAMKRYFAMRAEELSQYGLVPFFQYADMPQRPHLGVGIVVCAKHPAGGRVGPPASA